MIQLSNQNKSLALPYADEGIAWSTEQFYSHLWAAFVFLDSALPTVRSLRPQAFYLPVSSRGLSTSPRRELNSFHSKTKERLPCPRNSIIHNHWFIADPIKFLHKWATEGLGRFYFSGLLLNWKKNLCGINSLPIIEIFTNKSLFSLPSPQNYDDNHSACGVLFEVNLTDFFFFFFLGLEGPATMGSWIMGGTAATIGPIVSEPPLLGFQHIPDAA